MKRICGILLGASVLGKWQTISWEPPFLPFKISLYCGRRILPSLFLGIGYVDAGRSAAISALFE